MVFRPGTDRVEYGGALIGKRERNAVIKVLDSHGGRRWTIGPESLALEAELAEKTGVQRAVLTNSGSSALLVALTSLHLPKGSNVIVPALNFPTAYNAILQCGLNPLVVDCNRETMNIDVYAVQQAMMQEGAEAVIAVDIAGNPADLEGLREVMGDKYIILDNADGYGTTYKGKFIDTYADLSCVSFHAAHIITMGEGGAVLTNNEELANRCKKIREWGRASGTDNIYEYPGFPKDYRERYVYEEIGYNVKPLELQCAMGRVQLKRLPEFKAKRAENFNRLMKVFEKYPEFETVKYLPESETCWFSFPFMCRAVSRERTMRMLEEANIECRTIFSGNILKHPAYEGTPRTVVGDLTNADDVMENGVFISVHPSITPKMIRWIDVVLATIVEQ